MSGPRVLVTAFEPYDDWPDNSSWRALVELARDLPAALEVTTRRYPVDFEAVRDHLASDLRGQYDYAVHLGQAPGRTSIAVETVALNLAQPRGGIATPILEAAPLAYRSPLPLEDWVTGLHQQGIPAELSFHAGTYVCNATLFWSLHLAEAEGLPTKATFLHLPLDVPQTLAPGRAGTAALPGLSSKLVADGLRWVLGQLAAD